MLWKLGSFFFCNLFIYFTYLFYLFIFGCVGSSLLRACFLQLRRAGATLRCSAWASHCGGFSCCGARALGMRASVVVARGRPQLWLAGIRSCGSRALERRLSSCGARASLLRDIWELPGPGLEPLSPAIGRRILNNCTTREAPKLGSLLGNQWTHFFKNLVLFISCVTHVSPTGG